MEKLWKAITRQRPLWPPDWSFVLVIALSIALGVWPLADPQWTKKGAYLTVVVAMLIIGSLLSARDRWRLELRYAADFGAHLVGVRARVFTLEKHLAGIALEYRAAHQSGKPFDLERAYLERLDYLTGTISEMAHLGILMSPNLMATMDREPKGLEDVKIILQEVIKMNEKLGELYRRTLSGD